MKPLIGLSVNLDEDEKLLSLNIAYVKAIEEAGGLPVLLPMLKDKQDAQALIGQLNGLLLTGGCDANPMLFGEDTSCLNGRIDPTRDMAESLYVQSAWEKDLPILGICRGIQMLNVARGGSLFQDIYEFNKEKKLHQHIQKMPMCYNSHNVKTTIGTLLADIAGTNEFGVNSSHHQAVNQLGDGLKICAVSDDGLIEAIYAPEKKFVLGVQWHPERNYQNSKESKAIFISFVNTCK